MCHALVFRCPTYEGHIAFGYCLDYLASVPPIGVFGGFGRESPSEKRLASRVDNSSLPAGK